MIDKRESEREIEIERNISVMVYAKTFSNR
jgi:hypothetical protein